MLTLTLRADQVSAVVEGIVALCVIVITVSLSFIANLIKAHRLLRNGHVAVTPNDFTSGLGHLSVIVVDRYFSLRGLFVVIIATTVTVLSATVQLGTIASRCSIHEGLYGQLTEPSSSTTCYTEKPVPTSGRVPAAILARLGQLLNEEKHLPLRVHPRHFDLRNDQITDFTIIPDDHVWGRVVNISSCNYKLFVNDGVAGYPSASQQLLDWDGTEDEFQPAPNVDRWSARFGFLQEQTVEKSAHLFAKEVRTKGMSSVHLLVGHADYDPIDRVIELQNTSCASLWFEGGGLRVLPFADAAKQLARQGVDIERLIEVAWLAATISEQTPRQKRCFRSNYKIRECTRISNNTTLTIIGLTVAALIGFIICLVLFMLNRGNQISNIFTKYQLFAHAARTKQLGRVVDGKISNTTNVQLRADEKVLHLYWENEYDQPQYHQQYCNPQPYY